VLSTYQEAANDLSGVNNRINIIADNWSDWISAAQDKAINLLAGRGTKAGPELNWNRWRWPLALVMALMLINAAALNFDWWRLKNETNTLRATLIQIYKAAYPNDSVILDPIAQMQQKISLAKRNSGQAGSDDFSSITAAFGEEWSGISLTTGKQLELASLEYHDRSLFVHLKPLPGSNPGISGEALTQQLKTALASHSLALEFIPEKSGNFIWKIRSQK
jgi:general secretion pathway protein L